MLQQPINLSPDIARLRDDGYEVEIIGAYLVIRGVPYVNAKKKVRRGTLISETTLNGDPLRPKTHVALFTGEYPCDKNGVELSKIRHAEDRREIGNGLFARFSFSSKPAEGYYPDFHAKMTTYIAIISGQAEAIDPLVTARTFRVIESVSSESVFNYLDTATSNAGIIAASRKLELDRIAIVGTGGTGSYVLDFTAKTPVKEIHLFDGDRLLQHNAFRTPGAPSIEKLKEIPYKVHYLAEIYSSMRKGIVPHNIHIDASNVELLTDFNFVFLCMDGGAAKRVLIEKLELLGIDFVDVGMGVEVVDDRLTGLIRTTTSTKAKREHVHTKGRIPLTGDGHENIYSTNIQIAELNALNAAYAVIKWKKLCGFYADTENEHFSVYALDGNAIVNEDE